MPWKLWAAVGCLLLMDLVLLTTWTTMDPLKREVRNFAQEQSLDQDLVIQPQLEHCKSTHHNVWLGKQSRDLGVGWG